MTFHSGKAMQKVPDTCSMYKVMYGEIEIKTLNMLLIRKIISMKSVEKQ